MEGARDHSITAWSSVPEDRSLGVTGVEVPVGASGVVDPARPLLFPDEEEWRPPSRAPSLTPEDSRPGDAGDFQSGEEMEKDSLTSWSPDREMYPLTIEHGENRNDSPLHAVSWVDESHPGWRMIRTVMDSGATDSVAHLL